VVVTINTQKVTTGECIVSHEIDADSDGILLFTEHTVSLKNSSQVEFTIDTFDFDNIVYYQCISDEFDNSDYSSTLGPINYTTLDKKNSRVFYDPFDLVNDIFCFCGI